MLEKNTPLNILFICDAPSSRYGQTANTLYDYVRSFDIYGYHTYHIISSVGDLPNDLDINAFDGIILHWSLYLIKPYYLSLSARNRIKAFKGVKAVFIQDEYRTIEETNRLLNWLEIDILFTCMSEVLQKLIYPKDKLPHVEKHQVLTGYVPVGLCHIAVKPIKDRQVDIFYRGRTIPFWLGRVALEKSYIGEGVTVAAQNTNFILDIKAKESERLYGEVWIEKLSDARATLGVESTATLLDFTGNLQEQTENYLRNKPYASFDEVELACFNGLDNKITTAQISPRIFEAIALRTPLILFKGEYSNILIPNIHYIELQKDFSNIKFVLNLLNNHIYLQEMVDRAYKDIGLNPTFSYFNFVKQVDEIIYNNFFNKGLSPSATEFDKDKTGINKYYWFLSRFSKMKVVKNTPLGTFSDFINKSNAKIRYLKKNILQSFFYPIWTRMPITLKHQIKPKLIKIAQKFKIF